VADFGFTTEGTSTTQRTTRNARGTTCYRAPELIDEDNAVYTNKADIWSVGCILYEFAVCRKAFNSDLATFYYMISAKEVDVPLDETFDKESKSQITKTIVCLLRIEPSSRPSASDLLEQINHHCQPTDSPQTSSSERH
jgi:serine/threonine protein kinase